ncbi:glycosyl hydrolase family 28-related protein, partial [Limosilactobacillus reuteri]|uniref:glycosyl hydrolase family 28-related protein n=1 Tax=Limosilactobacillus reuteri TaxID=1598 RepID=UPI00226F4D56
MPVQQIKHNNDGKFYHIAIDIAKEGAQLFDLTPYVKGRVGDNNFGLLVDWYRQGMLMNVNGTYKPIIDGSVGNFSFDKNGNLKMDDDASPVYSEGKPEDCGPAGQVTYYFPEQMFPKEGIFKGYLGLIDDKGNRYSGVDIWFAVLAGNARMGIACDFYISKLEKAIVTAENDLANSKKSMRQVVDEFVSKMNDLTNRLETQANTDQMALDALEAKIKQDGLFTQAEAEAFKQAIEKELASRIGDVASFKARGTSLSEKTLNEFSSRAENVTWHGVVGDGKTDNTQALQELSKWVDQQGGKQVLYFPPGKYLWNETVQFNTPVVLTGTEESWLKYTGTGDGLLLGPDGLTDDNYINYRSFTVKNLCFTGGDNSKYLIRFNKHITQGRVTDCQFHNAGGIADDSSCFCIWFSQDAWDGRVTGCQFDATAEAGRKQFVGMDEYGNSRIVIANNLVTSLTAKGVAIYLNGYNCQAIGNKIEGFEVNIRLGAMASACEVAFNYFEKSGDNVSAAIQIGSLNPDVVTYPTGIYIIGNYANLHNVTKEMWSYFIGPSNSNVLIRETIVESNYVNAGNWNDPNDVRYGYLVLENNLPNQLGNRANNNYLGVGIKGIIDFNNQSKYESWRGQDSNDHLWTPLDKNRPLTHDVMIPDDQMLVLNALDQKWQLQAQLRIDAYRNIILSTKTESNAIEVFQNGQVA